MRLWSLHPSILDRAALVSCWREGLLAQKVLGGGTKGYTKHPQLERFRESSDPMSAVGHYLTRVGHEASARGYRFDVSKIVVPDAASPSIHVTDGQLLFELAHLRAKVVARDAAWLARLPASPLAAPTFVVVPGPVASWERP